MTRMSKQNERRSVSRRRPKPPSKKTGPKRDQLAQGYRPHENVAISEKLPQRFFPKNS